MCAIDGVDDAVLASAPDAAGNDRLYVVIDFGRASIVEQAGEWIAALLAGFTDAVLPVVVRAMPRTEAGKVRRLELRDAQARTPPLTSA
jgi:acyl-coenzyme A synthetase/AMP-(fatty) acid ligase